MKMENEMNHVNIQIHINYELKFQLVKIDLT